MLAVRDVSVRYQGFLALSGASFDLQSGQWLMVLGANGAGKSTLLSAVAQTVPYQGQVLLHGKEARGIKSRAFARQVAVLRQSHGVGYAFSVEQLVSLGRYAHQGPFIDQDAAGPQKITEALQLCGLLDKRCQNVQTLSGGELQRAFLAQVFAQDAPLLLLDEPTSHLDLRYQRELFDIISIWLKTPGRAVLAVVHDLLLARRYGSHGVLLKSGQMVAAGSLEAVLTHKHLSYAYGMDVAGWFHQLYQPWLSDVAVQHGHTGNNPV